MSTVANNYDGLVQTFEKIIADKTMDDDTLDYACETDVVFDIVQQRAMDVLYCKKRLESLLAYVKGKRSEGAFQAVYAKAANLKLDLRTEPHNCRIPRSTTKICTSPSWTGSLRADTLGKDT